MITARGYLAVDFFFFLSGFVLTYVYRREFYERLSRGSFTLLFLGLFSGDQVGRPDTGQPHPQKGSERILPITPHLGRGWQPGSTSGSLAGRRHDQPAGLVDQRRMACVPALSVCRRSAVEMPAVVGGIAVLRSVRRFRDRQSLAARDESNDDPHRALPSVIDGRQTEADPMVCYGSTSSVLQLATVPSNCC